MVIEQAFVAGRFGRAVYLAENAWWISDYEVAPRHARSAEVADFELFKLEYKEIEAKTVESVRIALDTEVNFQNLLFLCFCILDPTTNLSSRLTGALAVENELENRIDFQPLLERLISAPLSSEARAVRSTVMSYISSFERLHALLHTVYESQNTVDEVVGIWNKLANTVSANDALTMQSALVQDGTFSKMVQASQAQTVQQFNAVMVDVLMKRRDQGISVLVKPILSEMRSRLQQTFFEKKPRQVFLPLRHQRERQTLTRVQPVEDLLNQQPVFRVSNISAFEAKTSVDKQIAAIRQEMLMDRIDLADRYINDLVRFQIDHSGREHLAKSLCRLAATAISANQLEVADRVSQYAVTLGIDDPVVFTTRAEVLKNLGYFEAALVAFKEARERFPDSPYAWNGIADVLKELGRFEESLAAYKDASAKFPESSVSSNGYTSTLNAQGRHAEALRHAFHITKSFPGDVVSISALAGTLSMNGKYAAAIRQYERLLEQGHDEVRVLQGYLRSLNATGQSEKALNRVAHYHKKQPDDLTLSRLLVGQLRFQGRYDEALTLAKSTVKKAPGYTPMKFELAATLVVSGDVETAEKQLPIKDLKSEMDWLGYRVYVVSLLSSGRLQTALSVLNEAIKKCIWRKPRLRLITLLGFTQLRLKRAPAAIKTLEHDIESMDHHTRQSRLVLIGASQRTLGRFSASQIVFTRVSETKDPVITAFKEAILGSSKNQKISKQIEVSFLMAA